MQIPDVEVFAAVATASSLSGAARRLGLSAMTVSRRLASLEKELGVRLVHRTTRSASLTPEGEVLLPFVRSILEADEAARHIESECRNGQWSTESHRFHRVRPGTDHADDSPTARRKPGIAG